MAKPRVKHYLVNEKYEDPGLVIEIDSLGEYILFDVGNIRKLDRHLLRKVNKIFITHTHMDHFIGFDHLLRNKLGREQTVEVFGINPLAENLYCKLQGYTWNLVEFEPRIVFNLKQYNSGLFEYYSYDIKKKFARDFIKEEKADTDVIYENQYYRVRYAVLDHKIPVMGYSFEYKDRLLLKKDSIKDLPLEGRQIGEFKSFLADENNRGKSFTIDGREYGWEELREKYSYVQEGIKISYITDVVFSEENFKKIINLVKGSDVLYCEAVFLPEDREQASKVYHLTADQTALIAKEAGVKKLVVFHFSRRYANRWDRIIEEIKPIFPNVE
ncbi:MAG: ribonuclease Z [Aquificae bacterium]|nr:ribonuclease Z [Aquificota bacterium]